MSLGPVSSFNFVIWAVMQNIRPDFLGVNAKCKRVKCLMCSTSEKNTLTKAETTTDENRFQKVP